MVRVAGFEPTASWSRTMRATDCAPPGKLGGPPGPAQLFPFEPIHYNNDFPKCQEQHPRQTHGKASFSIPVSLCKNAGKEALSKASFPATTAVSDQAITLGRIPGISSASPVGVQPFSFYFLIHLRNLSHSPGFCSCLRCPHRLRASWISSC